MPWIKIFISHSTKTEEADEFLRAVAKALAEDFDVRLDRTGLQGGDDWRAKLYEWMDEVHGAVLLLTPEALNSKFVQLEASVLSWRSFRQPKFVLLPVLVGVGVEELSKGLFGEMELSRIQNISLDKPDELAQQVVKALRVLKERDTPRTAKEVLEQRVVKLLKGGRSTEDDLREAGRSALGWKDESFAAGTDYYEKFARDLLCAETGDACSAIRELVGAGMRDALELLALVTPSWVEEEAAKPIAQIALSELSQRTVSLNTTDPWTLDAYISRSCHTSLNHGLPVCRLVPPSLQDSLSDFRRQILESFKPKDPYAAARAPDPTGEVVKRILKKRYEKPQPVFVFFPAGFIPDAKLLDPLREEFKTVTFVVLAGDAPQEKLSPIADRVTILKPVNLERSQDAYDEYTMIYEDLQNLA